MLESIEIKNFKAIKSAKIKMTDLSVFVGNNGSGKSSVIEALQLLQNALRFGLSTAFQDRWYGFDYIRNAATDSIKSKDNSIGLTLRGKLNKKSFTYTVGFNTTRSGDLYIVSSEELKQGKEIIIEPKGKTLQLAEHKALFAVDLRNYILSWQFLCLEPEQMYHPTQRDYSKERVRMKTSGGNLADFYRRLLDKPELYNLIHDKLRYVLPDLDYVGGEELAVQKQVYLFLTEYHTERISNSLAHRRFTKRPRIVSPLLKTILGNTMM